MGVLDGVYRAGAIYWACLVFVLISGSEVQEDNLFQWFNYYAGVMPWGAVIGVLALLSVVYTVWDYRRAPVDLEDFLRAILRMAEVLELGPGTASSRSKRLAAWADDLEDSIKLNLSPRVRELDGAGQEFLLWKEQAIALGDFESFSPERKAAIAKELEAISTDIREFHHAVSRLQDRVIPLPRPSPFLATYRQ